MEGAWASILPVNPTIEILQHKQEAGARKPWGRGAWRSCGSLWPAARQAILLRVLAQPAGDVCCSLGIDVPGVEHGDTAGLPDEYGTSSLATRGHAHPLRPPGGWPPGRLSPAVSGLSRCLQSVQEERHPRSAGGRGAQAPSVEASPGARGSGARGAEGVKATLGKTASRVRTEHHHLQGPGDVGSSSLARPSNTVVIPDSKTVSSNLSISFLPPSKCTFDDFSHNQ